VPSFQTFLKVSSPGRGSGRLLGGLFRCVVAVRLLSVFGADCYHCQLVFRAQRQLASSCRLIRCRASAVR